MIGWFVSWLERFVKMGLDLAVALITGILTAPFRATTKTTVRAGTASEVIDVRHAVLRAGKDRSTAVFEGDDAPGARHFIAERSGVIVAVLSLLPAPMPPPHPPGMVPVVQLRGMGVLSEHRSKGIGRELLAATAGTAMWCNARSEAVGFYEAQGWQPIGEPFDVPGIGLHRRLWRR